MAAGAQIPIPAGAVVDAEEGQPNFPAANAPGLSPGQRVASVLRADPRAAARVAAMLRQNVPPPEYMQSFSRRTGRGGVLGGAENVVQGASRNILSQAGRAISPFLPSLGARMLRENAAIPGASETAGRLGYDALEGIGAFGGATGAAADALSSAPEWLGLAGRTAAAGGAGAGLAALHGESPAVGGSIAGGAEAVLGAGGMLAPWLIRRGLPPMENAAQNVREALADRIPALTFKRTVRNAARAVERRGAQLNDVISRADAAGITGNTSEAQDALTRGIEEARAQGAGGLPTKQHLENVREGLRFEQGERVPGTTAHEPPTPVPDEVPASKIRALKQGVQKSLRFNSEGLPTSREGKRAMTAAMRALDRENDLAIPGHAELNNRLSAALRFSGMRAPARGLKQALMHHGLFTGLGGLTYFGSETAGLPWQDRIPLALGAGMAGEIAGNPAASRMLGVALDALARRGADSDTLTDFLATHPPEGPATGALPRVAVRRGVRGLLGAGEDRGLPPTARMGTPNEINPDWTPSEQAAPRAATGRPLDLGLRGARALPETTEMTEAPSIARPSGVIGRVPPPGMDVTTQPRFRGRVRLAGTPGETPGTVLPTRAAEPAEPPAAERPNMRPRATPRAARSASAAYQRAASDGGADFAGTMPRSGGQEPLVLFNDPETHNTLALPGDQMTPENVRAKIASSRRTFNAAKRPGPGASLPGDVHRFTPEETELHDALEAALNAIPGPLGNVPAPERGMVLELPNGERITEDNLFLESPEEAEERTAEARALAQHWRTVQGQVMARLRGEPEPEPVRPLPRIKEMTPRPRRPVLDLGTISAPRIKR